MEKINEIMQQLAQYNRMQEETAAIIDGLKDQIKAYMTENNLDTLTGDEHKAIYKAVESSRIDTTALKKDLPNIAAQYTKTTAVMRFTFA
jgi:predicted phage-related endonuclease